MQYLPYVWGLQMFLKQGQIWSFEGARGPAVPYDIFKCKTCSKHTATKRSSLSQFDVHNATGNVINIEKPPSLRHRSVIQALAGRIQHNAGDHVKCAPGRIRLVGHSLDTPDRCVLFYTKVIVLDVWVHFVSFKKLCLFSPPYHMAKTRAVSSFCVSTEGAQKLFQFWWWSQPFRKLVEWASLFCLLLWHKNMKKAMLHTIWERHICFY